MSVERVGLFLGSSLLIWGDSLLWRDALIDKPKAPCVLEGCHRTPLYYFGKYSASSSAYIVSRTDKAFVLKRLWLGYA